MDLKQVLVPFHFGLRWDILPRRSGSWTVVTTPRLSSRLVEVSCAQADIVVSGDCMAAIAAHRPELGLVWFDAHGDFHTLETTYTGSLGGMPLAIMAGLGDQTLMKLCRQRPVSRIVHVGGSEFDPGEEQAMLEAGVAVVGVEEFHDAPYPCHLHIDTDVIRTADLPSSIHPAPRGMTLRQFWTQLDIFFPATKVLSIKTYDPRLDATGEGEQIVLEILRRFHGHKNR